MEETPTPSEPPGEQQGSVQTEVVMGKQASISIVVSTEKERSDGRDRWPSSFSFQRCWTPGHP